jgi:RimJ/RimL family protein N-acetyltransferase
MANIKFRLARRGDIQKLIEISNHPSNLAEGSVPWYLLAGRYQNPDTVSAAWEEAIVDNIYSTSGWYTCVVAEVEDTKEIVGYCAWEWFDYDEMGKRVVEKHRPARLQTIWDELGTLRLPWLTPQ